MLICLRHAAASAAMMLDVDAAAAACHADAASR